MSLRSLRSRLLLVVIAVALIAVMAYAAAIYFFDRETAQTLLAMRRKKVIQS